MNSSISRRGVLGGLGLMTLGAPAFAQGGRILRINTLASAAAVNVPMQAALRSVLGTMPGYANAEVRPTARIPQIAQEVIAAAADMGDADVATTLTAAEAGADIRIIGLSYDNTTQVVVANLDKTKSLEALAKSGGTIAVNSIGDFTYVMMLGILAKRGIDAKQLNFIEMGGSGDRVRGLLAGRVDAVFMHVEQAMALSSQGNYRVLVQPSDEYQDWFSAVLMTTQTWLNKDENKAAAVAVLKSILTAFRKTNTDYDWYARQFRIYDSSKEMRAASDTFIRPVWETLTQKLKLFPADMATLNPDQFAKIVPVYQAAGTLKGTVDLKTVIDRTYLEQALKELA